ncbi:MAG: prepilin-type N-terminal cleavage/methylation domain-containing protein [Candidatus Omnitrophota bacterium]|nr:MAG: prepilin-type N-terminal cleavage/methylation domain-containing protein [Candidatus Omnitrophota bacterium]
MMKRSLTLIEVLVAVAIFASLSISLYLLLRSGIRVRNKIESQQATFQNIYLRLERTAQELRNVIFFKKNDSGFKELEEKEMLEFYTLIFDYSTETPRLLHITYSFQEGTLTKTIKEPFGEESLRSFHVIENVESFHFSYFDEKNIEEPWQEKWENIKRLPQGIKMQLIYKDERGKLSSLNKYVFLHRYQDAD